MIQGHPRRVAVLGAGITGLAAACELRQRSGRGPAAEVTVFESATRVGGRIRSETNDGVVYEAGVDAFSTVEPQTLELVRELGLESELVRAGGEHRRIFLLCAGVLKPLPAGLSLGLSGRAWTLFGCDLLTWKGRLRAAWEPFVPSVEGESDESLAAFFGRRLGPEPAAKLAGPLLAGLFAGDPEKLSLRSAFPQFSEMEGRGGVLRELLRGRPPRLATDGDVGLFMTLKGGLSRLPEAMARRLPQAGLRLGSAVTRLTRRGGQWEVLAGRGPELFDAVVSALPAPALAAVLDVHDPELAGVLREIPCASSAVVTLAYERRDLPRLPDGCGLLVPRGEARRLAAVTFTSARFPSLATQDLVVFRALLGGAGREADAEGDEASVARTARNELRDILGLGEAHPRWSRVTRWPLGNPQYTIGHSLRLKRLESCLQSHPGLVLSGASYRGIGLSDAIRSGRAAAKALGPGAGRAASGVA